MALKCLGEKSCEIKGGGQEMAAMMLMLKILIMAVCIVKFISINIFAAISWPPPLISQLFSPRHFKATPFFPSLAVFVRIVCIQTFDDYMFHK